MAINFDLKNRLARRYGSQIKGSLAMGIRESRLSHFVQGHAKPTDRERKALEKGLGRGFVAKVLNGKSEKLAV